MPNYEGTVEEFEGAVGAMTAEALAGYAEDDDRVGVRDAAARELARRETGRAESEHTVTFEAHMAHDGTVVVDTLEFDNPDFLDLAAGKLTEAAAEARNRHATALTNP